MKYKGLNVKPGATGYVKYSDVFKDKSLFLREMPIKATFKGYTVDVKGVTEFDPDLAGLRYTNLRLIIEFHYNGKHYKDHIYSPFDLGYFINHWYKNEVSHYNDWLIDVLRSKRIFDKTETTAKFLKMIYKRYRALGSIHANIPALPDDLNEYEVILYLGNVFYDNGDFRFMYKSKCRPHLYEYVLGIAVDPTPEPLPNPFIDSAPTITTTQVTWTPNQGVTTINI